LELASLNCQSHSHAIIHDKLFHQGCKSSDVRVGSKPENLNASTCFPLFTQQRTSPRYFGMSVSAIRDILHCRIQHVIQSCGRRWHRGPYPRPIAEVSSGSAINITSEVIDHGHRPRPHRRCCSCFAISRASRRMRTWKSFDWATMERLHTKGLISDPVGKAKSVVFTDEGLRQSEALFRKLFTVGRSEERRVGKECRSRWSPY